MGLQFLSIVCVISLSHFDEKSVFFLVKITLKSIDVGYFFISALLVTACRNYFYHCDMSLWSISNRKWGLIVGHAVSALLQEEFFIGSRQKRLRRLMETVDCPPPPPLTSLGYSKLA